ncbi:MerR family DNA-binding transcriptional regulator [Desulfitobacterium chlororespirans]|uniref:MerR family DNA-binding transcriptional regulator n=1 Tax=Desulfitobacterium chlororespirans TaxID=51616 RepID=UPI00249EE504|nr:MerR family DNA-binding transcriptional regulator [Desulfitobacterium chlororespirans]
MAQHFGISNTTVRVYEEIGLIPQPTRTKSGYRIYTNEHVAYYACIRIMLSGFSLTKIAKILTPVINKDIDTALWLANKAQADLQQEKIISQKMMENLFERIDKSQNSITQLLTVTEMSKLTGVPATTIRYWDKVGLLTAMRQTENNYRIFTIADIKKVHVIYAIKFASFASSKRYSVNIIRQQLDNFDYDNKEQIEKLAQDFYRYLDNLNRNQIKSIAALYHLCQQVEADIFEPLIGI